ncbi:hypothetical protein SLS62_002635 [Diatrype stigma]|uniref:Uncharacterized protein n=1 Tax=Diatrype stigma TaxID=117547 RepID=A0AAN9V8D7_9PEZI
MPSNGTAVEVKVNFDWTRDPPPPSLSPFQRLIRDVDWAKTGFGPMASWPTELRTIVRVMMVDTAPVVLYWGPTNAIIYNEAYMPLIGQKHPSILGMDATEVFLNFGGVFEDILCEQRKVGLTQSGEASMLLIERHGFLEETYCNWKLIPVIDDNGDVVGSYTVTFDLTKDVIWTRRNECVTKLAHNVAQAKTISELWQITTEGLERDEKDLPFALLYSAKEKTGTNGLPSNSYGCHLQGTIGVDRGHALAPEYLDLQDNLSGFAPSMLEAVREQSMVAVDADDEQLCGLLEGVGWRGYRLPCRQFVVVPINTDGQIAAFLIVGLNPYRRYNVMYREFLKLVADVLAPQVARLQLSQEVDRRAELARRATLDFQKSEMKFTLLAERSIVGLAMTDNDGKIRYANDAWYRFTGLTPSVGVDLRLEDGVVPEDVELLRQWHSRILSEKSGGTFQFRSKEPFRRGNMYSEHRTGICACYADLNESDEIDSLMVLVMDISELKWTEQQLLMRTRELEVSEAKYRNFADHCPLGIVRTDGEGYVQYGNEAWFKFYDLNPDDINTMTDPQPWLKFVHEDDIQRAKDFFFHMGRSDRAESIEIRIKSKKYTMPEGEGAITIDTYILTTGFSEYKPDGTLDYIDFWVADISAHKMAAQVLTNKMEEAIRLKTQQERFIDMVSHEIRNPLSAVLHCGEEIVEAMRKSSTLLDAVLDSTSPSTCRSSKMILQRQVFAALEAARTVMYCVQHQKQIVDDVLTLSKLDSDLLVVSPVPVHLMALVRSSLKIFEAELRVAGIGLEIVKDDSIDRLGLDWVLLDPNRYMQILINLVTNAIKFTKPSHIRRITVTVSASAHRPPAILRGVDLVPRRRPLTTSQNASQTAAITQAPVLFGPFDEGEDIFLSLSVKDTGKGLTTSEKALLFKRFAQVSPKTHIEYGGSGLGLFISRQITELLGGEIGMASDPNSGSVFAFYVRTRKTTPPPDAPDATETLIPVDKTLSLTANMEPMSLPERKDGLSIPRRASVPKNFSITTSPSSSSPPPPSNRSILVVEDNLVNQKVLCKQLRNRNFVVKATNHGREALDVILATPPPASGSNNNNEGDSRKREKKQKSLSTSTTAAMTQKQTQTHTNTDTHTDTHFDIVLCDIEMPIMNGLEFAKRVRDLEKQGKLPGHLPIIAVTANDGVTTKPYRIQELIDQIDRLCPKIGPACYGVR